MLFLPTIVILAISSIFSAANPEADSGDEILRSEIESAARESRALADDLAAMLARLEAEESREDAVDAAVIGDNKKVKEALTEMVDKIEELAKASEDSNLSQIAGAVENERINEDELERTLEELEIVAIQIEEVASSADSAVEIDAIEQAAVLLQAVSDKVEEKTKNIDKGNEKSTNVNKENGKTSLELNGIDEMIASLEKVTHDLRDLNVQSENINSVQTEDLKDKFIKNQRKQIKLEKARQESTVSAGTDKKESKEAQSDTKKMRKPKQLDDSIKDNEMLEGSKKIKNVEKKKDDENRKPKELKEGEECTDNEVSNRVRVCVPKVTSIDTSIHLYSGEVREERHCFDVTKTICEESSQIVSKEVCVYSYKQKTVVAPAQMTEVTWERRLEKLAVSKCKKEILKDGYKENEVEVCKQDYVEAPYTLPSVADNINEFIEMSIPEPDENCQTYRYEIPEVNCKDVTTRECSDVAHVEPVPVTEQLETVQMDYKGKCGQRNLEQVQQVCTKEQKVKQPRQGYRG